MSALNVGVNSTFEQQRQVINSLAIDVFSLTSSISGFSTGGLTVEYSNTAGVATYANLAGVSTYATISGLSTYSSTSGVATVANYASVAGIASALNFIPNYSHNSGIASYALVSGIATNANYATSSSQATFAFYAGISTYAGTAGIATVSQGITGTPNVQVGVITASLYVGDGSGLTGLNVGVSTFADVAGFATDAGTASYAVVAGFATASASSSVANYTPIAGFATAAAGLTGVPNLNVGILTATKFAANNAEFTGILTAQSLKAISGYILSPDNQQSIRILSGSGGVTFPLGIGSDINVAGIVTGTKLYGDASNVTGITTAGITSVVAGANVIVEQTGNVAIVTATFSGSSTGYFEGGNAGIGTTSAVGIGTTIPTEKLSVKGNASIDGNIIITGEISAPTRIKFGTGGENIKIGDLTGGNNAANVAIGDQALSSNNGGLGHNIAIGQLAQYAVNSGQYNVAIGDRAGQNLTTGSYNVILGGYNGQTGLDIRTSSNNIVLSDGQGNIRQYINSSGNVGIKTTIITEALTVAGVVSATSFYGTIPSSQLSGALPALDGSALTGVTAVGSGVEIREDGTPVGVAATIDFGNLISVQFNSGIATITGSSSVTFASFAGGLNGQPDIIVGDIETNGDITGFTSITGAANQFFTRQTNGETGAVVGINTIPQNDLEGFGTLILDGKYYFAADQKGGGNIEMRNMGRPWVSTACWDSVGLTSFIGYSQVTQTYLYKPYVYRTAGTGQALIGITTLGNIGIATLTPTTTLDVFGDAKVSGALTATSLSGTLDASNLTGALPAIDGSNLLNVTAIGSGVAIEDDGVSVGAAVTVINFDTGLNVTSSSGVATVTGSGGGTQSRTTVSGVTTSIPNLGIGNTDITGFKSYALMKVGLSTAGWIRLYTDSTSRANDVTRSVGEDPAPGSGVIAEVVTTGISTQQIITPFAMGGNMDEPVTNKIYVAIKNLSGSTQTITANLTILQLEA